jgi:hypothetical protein
MTRNRFNSGTIAAGFLILAATFTAGIVVGFSIATMLQ